MQLVSDSRQKKFLYLASTVMERFFDTTCDSLAFPLSRAVNTRAPRVSLRIFKVKHLFSALSTIIRVSDLRINSPGLVFTSPDVLSTDVYLFCYELFVLEHASDASARAAPKQAQKVLLRSFPSPTPLHFSACILRAG